MAVRVLLVTRGRAVAAATALLVLAAGCKAETTLFAVNQPQGYEVRMLMDPITLNPPQLGSLTFRVTDTATNKAVTEFEPLHGALLHNVLVREDLDFFRHDVATNLIREEVSVPALFPSTGSYSTFAMYKPVGAAEQQYKGRITSGDTANESNLEETAVAAKNIGGLRVEQVRGPGPLVAGESQQLVFYVTERGQPVTGLWPLYGGPGHLWIVDSAVEGLAHVVGKADSTRFIEEVDETEGTPAPSPRASGTVSAGRATTTVSPARTGTRTPGSQGTGSTEGTGASSNPGSRELPEGILTDTTPPTLVPDLAAALASVTAAALPTLQPVQQTAQSAVLEGPAVPPAVGFGPTLIFTHTFLEPGLYKMWLEIQYNGSVTMTDWVVKVEP